MNHVILDLEMNQIDTDDENIKKQCCYEIIEIGAVVLNDDMEQTAEYKSYVKPEYNPILPHYTELTGITDDMVKDCDTFAAALTRFLDFTQEECSKPFKVYSWSLADPNQFRSEANMKGFKDERLDYMLENWIDFQKDFCKMLGSRRRVSLKDAVFYAGDEFKGKQHDALCDSINTALLFRLSKNKEEFNRIFAPLIEAYKPKKTMTFTMGDLLSNIKIDE